MSTLEALTGKNYLSYSSLQSLVDCGERFRLERIEQVPQENAWWFIGGHAFHSATELLDRGEQDDADTAWHIAWDKTIADLGDVDLSTLRAGGRVSKEWPDKENGAWWQVHGPAMTAKYLTWRDNLFNEGWQFYETPAGPAVEVPVQLELGGVLVKGYIDRIMVNADGELIVMDLKTGNYKPASSLQLGVYALGVEHHLGVRPILGSYYMSRKAELTPPVSLLHYTPEVVGSWFARGKAIVENELFIPHVTSMCGTCGVRAHCAAVGGNKVLQTASSFL